VKNIFQVSFILKNYCCIIDSVLKIYEWYLNATACCNIIFCVQYFQDPGTGMSTILVYTQVDRSFVVSYNTAHNRNWAANFNDTTFAKWALAVNTLCKVVCKNHSYEYAWPFIKYTYCTYSILLKMFSFCTLHKSSVGTGFAKHIMHILRILCYNGSLGTRTVVKWTTTKFKTLIFSMSGFAFSYTMNMFILMILCDLCLFPAQFCYIIIYILKVPTLTTSQSQSYFITGSLSPISSSWQLGPLRFTTSNFFNGTHAFIVLM
jgi:hypothetical protein